MVALTRPQPQVGSGSQTRAERQEVGVRAIPVHSGGPVCVRGGRSSPGHTAQVRAGPWGLAPAGRAGISQARPRLTWGGTGAGRRRGRWGPSQAGAGAGAGAGAARVKKR